jgi:cyclase
LKAGGQKVEQVIASKPTADLDDAWGKGMVGRNDFVALVYNTL